MLKALPHDPAGTASPARVFQSEEARARLQDWYRKFLARIPSPMSEVEVPSFLGTSHVLLAGNPEGPPLVCLHPMLTSSAHVISELGPAVHARYRLIGLDVPGQSVHGPEARPPLGDGPLGRWALEVLTGLGIEEFRLFGVSWGGYVARQMATLAPHRVQKLVLLVPAGLVKGSLWQGFRLMAWPMLRYRLKPTEENLRAMLDPILTTSDDDWGHYTADAMRDFVPDMRIPPVATEAALRALTMPVLVFGGDSDISFPGQKMQAHLPGLVPQVQVELLPGCKHCPPTEPEFRRSLAQRIAAFLG